MPIQYSCPSCRQPIEMDDEFSGREATCPYCRTIGTVPPASTLMAPVGAARPVGTPAIPPPLHGAQPHLRDRVAEAPEQAIRRANRWGTAGLFCGLVAILLWSLGLYCTKQWLDALEKHGLTFPLGSEIEEVRQFQKDAMEIISADSKLAVFVIVGMGAFVGSLGVALLGFVFGVASLRASREQNLRGILSVVLSGLFLCCICGGMFFGSLFP